jgi:hypothetical protein
MEMENGRPKKIKPVYTTVFNKGVRPITLYKNRLRHGVLHPKKSESLVTALAEKLMETNKDLILYDEWLKKEEKKKDGK